MPIELLRDESALLRLEPEWESLLGDAVHPSIFMTFDYQYAGWKAFHRDDSEPYVIVARDAGGTVIGIAPFRRYCDAGWARWRRLGYLNAFEIDRPAPIVRAGHEAAFWRMLADFLESTGGSWDVVGLPEMPRELIGDAREAFVSGRQTFTTAAGFLRDRDRPRRLVDGLHRGPPEAPEATSLGRADGAEPRRGPVRRSLAGGRGIRSLRRGREPELEGGQGRRHQGRPSRRLLPGCPATAGRAQARGRPHPDHGRPAGGRGNHLHAGATRASSTTGPTTRPRPTGHRACS